MDNVKDHEIGRFLVEQGLISEETFQRCMDMAEKTGEKLIHVLLREGCVTEKQLLQMWATLMGYPFVDLQRTEADEKARQIVDKKIAERYKIFPVHMQDQTLHIATSDPLNLSVMDDLLVLTSCRIEFMVAPPDQIEWAIRRYYLPERPEPAPDGPEAGDEPDEDASFFLPETEAQYAPAISLVQSIISTALARRASDIHIEPREDELAVRFRIDGMLYEIMTIPGQMKASVISRLKVMARLRITEKKRPQDGGFHLKAEGRVIDVRVSVIPTVFGEKIVLRLLNKENVLALDRLGVEGDNLRKLRDAIHAPHGILLITGPTGSGKTTTLYAILRELNQPEKNITTIEDPVEYVIPRINQIQIHPPGGLTFASGLRAVLRQDPDIIMIGEIRDEETAKIAVHAALTGHLVLSTLHTHDAAGSVTRLFNMGIEPYLLAASLRGVLAQRLVRRICPECKTEERIPEHVLERTGIRRHPWAPSVFYRGIGCSWCQYTGYKGRIAISEMIFADDEVRELISAQASEPTLRKHLEKRGFRTMADDGLRKVAQGITTLEEYLRVIHS